MLVLILMILYMDVQMKAHVIMTKMLKRMMVVVPMLRAPVIVMVIQQMITVTVMVM